MTDLLMVAAEEQRAMRGGPLWAVTAARTSPYETSLARDLEDPEVLVGVGTIDRYVVGMVTTRLQPLQDDRLLAVVDELFVEPEAREVGVGELLMDLAVAWATERGCMGIDASVLPGNRQTKNFFESFGLVARSLTVHRSLEAP